MLLYMRSSFDLETSIGPVTPALCTKSAPAAGFIYRNGLCGHTARLLYFFLFFAYSLYIGII